MSDNRTIPSSVTGASVVLFVFLLLIAFLVWALRGPTDQNATHALIMAQEATILGPLVQHNVPTATVLLKNTGHSPARTVKARLVMTVWTSTTFPDWEMPLQLINDVRDLGNIEPGSSVSQTVPLGARSLTYKACIWNAKTGFS